MKSSVLDIAPQVNYWPHVVGTRQCGSGKVFFIRSLIKHIVQVGESDEYECLAVLQEHGQDVKSLCWHPLEEILVSASYDNTLRIYREDVDDFICTQVLSGHESTVWEASFAQQGDLLSKPFSPTLYKKDNQEISLCW